MFPIIAAHPLARNIKLFEIMAPQIAKKQRTGQFVIVRMDNTGERIPLTIADAQPEAGIVTFVVQAIGKTTMLLNMLEGRRFHPRHRRTTGQYRCFGRLAVLVQIDPDCWDIVEIAAPNRSRSMPA